MDKAVKISLGLVIALLLVGGGLLIYFKGGLYKDKSVREGEKKFRDFGSILESAEGRHPDVLMWYNDLPQSSITLIEQSFHRMTDEQKDKLIEGFKKNEMNTFTKNVLSGMGYKNVA